MALVKVILEIWKDIPDHKLSDLIGSGQHPDQGLPQPGRPTDPGYGQPIGGRPDQGCPSRDAQLIQAMDNQKVGILIRDSPALSRTQIKDYPAPSHGQIKDCRRNPGTRAISQFQASRLARLSRCRQPRNPRSKT